MINPDGVFTRCKYTACENRYNGLDLRSKRSLFEAFILGMLPFVVVGYESRWRICTMQMYAM